jgi:hypothetical protein
VIVSLRDLFHYATTYPIGPIREDSCYNYIEEERAKLETRHARVLLLYFPPSPDSMVFVTVPFESEMFKYFHSMNYLAIELSTSANIKYGFRAVLLSSLLNY